MTMTRTSQWQPRALPLRAREFRARLSMEVAGSDLPWSAHRRQPRSNCPTPKCLLGAVACGFVVACTTTTPTTTTSLREDTQSDQNSREHAYEDAQFTTTAAAAAVLLLIAADDIVVMILIHGGSSRSSSGLLVQGCVCRRRRFQPLGRPLLLTIFLIKLPLERWLRLLLLFRCGHRGVSRHTMLQQKE